MVVCGPVSSEQDERFLGVLSFRDIALGGSHQYPWLICCKQITSSGVNHCFQGIQTKRLLYCGSQVVWADDTLLLQLSSSP